MSAKDKARTNPIISAENGSGNVTAECTSADCEARAPMRKPSVTESLGVIGCIIIGVGSVLVVATMAFLIYLWAGNGPLPGGKEASRVWRSIMLKGWITQAITLSSVLIRVALALQASVCTSLVAALILENYGVPLSKAAQFTILRSVNGGPFTLVYLMSSIRSWTLPGVVIWILFLGTLASQFTSTILVSDLAFGSLVDFPYSTNISFMMSEQVYSNGYADEFNWGEAPNLVPFGEIPNVQNPAPNQEGFSDTGVLRRVWLPTDTNLMTMRSYAGPGWVVDSRVSCMRPAIDPIFESNPIDPSSSFVSGAIDYDGVYQQAGLDFPPPTCAGGQCLPAAFNCSIPSFTNPSHPMPNFLCVPDIGNSDSISSSNFTIQQSPILESSIVMIILATNATEANWTAISNLNSNFSSTGFDEWTVFQMDLNFTLNMTLCFFTQTAIIADVQLNINVSPKQPVTQWDLGSHSVNTTNIRNFMGVDNSNDTLEERGIFSIEKIDIPGSLGSTQTINITLAEINENAFFQDFGTNIVPADDSGETTGNQTFFLCYDCGGFHDVFPSIEYRMLFQDTLSYTQRPALAIQTLFGVAAQTFYYECLLWFDILGGMQGALSVTQRAPHGQNGLKAAIAITAVNLICIIFVTIWFLAKTRYTKRGNYWQAIAQASAPSDIRWIFDKADELTDSEVAQLLMGRDPKIIVGRSVDTERVQIVERVPLPKTNTSTTRRIAWQKLGSEASRWKSLRRSKSTS